RRSDQIGIALIRAECPLFGFQQRTTVVAVPGDQPFQPLFLIRSQEPGLVEYLTQLTPGVLVEQQVVSLRDDQGGVLRDRHSTRNRFLDLPPELGRVDEFRALTETPHEMHITVRVERVRCTLPVGAAAPMQLHLCQMKTVHADDHGASPELVRDLPCQGRLAGSGRACDPEYRTTVGRRQCFRTCQQLFERGHLPLLTTSEGHLGRPLRQALYRLGPAPAPCCGHPTGRRRATRQLPLCYPASVCASVCQEVRSGNGCIAVLGPDTARHCRAGGRIDYHSLACGERYAFGRPGNPCCRAGCRRTDRLHRRRRRTFTGYWWHPVSGCRDSTTE